MEVAEYCMARPRILVIKYLYLKYFGDYIHPNIIERKINYEY